MSSAEQSASVEIRAITRNYYRIWLSYAFAGGFLNGVYPIFLRSRGLSQFEVNSVLATYFIVTFLTDVPTGAFADAISRRTAFRIGCAIRSVAFAMYFFSHHYALFLVAEAIDGVGTTFGNGAIDAWAVDALDHAGHTGLKDRLFSRSSQLVNLGFLGSAIIGSYVASYDLSWPWLLGASGYAVCGILAGRLMRTDGAQTRKIEWSSMVAQISRRVRGGLSEGLRHRTILLLSVANAVQIASWAPLWLEWPRYYHEHLPQGVWIIGWLFCLFSIAGLIGAEFIVRRQPEPERRSNWLGFMMAAAALMIAGMGVASDRLAVVTGLYFISRIFTGAVGPISSAWLNEQIESGNRATMLSFNTTLATLGGSIGLLIGGKISDVFGLAAGWQFAGLLSLAAAPVYLALRARRIPAAAPVAAN